MNAPTLPLRSEETGALLDEVLALRAAVVSGAGPWMNRFSRDAGAPQPALANLAHYLAFRRNDHRAIQRKLMCRGISSLGRLESRVLPTLDAVIVALAAMS